MAFHKQQHRHADSLYTQTTLNAAHHSKVSLHEVPLKAQSVCLAVLNS